MKYVKINIPSKVLFFCLSIVIFVLFSFFNVEKSHAATATWTNGGADGLWSTCSNWSGGTGTGGCPGTGDIATFNNTSDADSTVDATFAGSVAGINVASGYDGTITQSRSLVVGTSDFIISSGIWNEGSQDISTIDSFTVNGGAFNSASGTVSFTDASATQDSTLTCSGAFAATVSVVKDAATTNDFTLASGCTATFGTFTVFGSVTLNGTANGTDMNIQFNLNVGASGAVNMSGSVNFIDSSASQDSVLTCTGTFGSSVNVVKDASTNNDFTLASGCTATFGTFTVFGSVIINGTANGTDMTIQFNLTVGGSGVLNMSGTVNFIDNSSNQDSVLTCTGTFGSSVSVVKDASTTSEFTLSSGCTANFGTFSVMGGVTVNGTANGTDLTTNLNLTVGANGVVNMSGTVNFIDTSTSQDSILTCTGTFGSSVSVAKDTSANNDFTLSSGCTATFTTLTVDGNTTINGTANGTNMTMKQNLIVGASGAVNMSGSVTFYDTSFLDSDSAMTCTGSFGSTVNVVKDASANNDFTLNSDCTVTFATFDVDGHTTINGTANGTNMTLEQNLTVGASGDVNMSGSVTFYDTTFLNNDSVMNCTGTFGSTVNVVKDASINNDFTLSTGCTLSSITSLVLGNFTLNGVILSGSVEMGDSGSSQSSTFACGASSSMAGAELIAYKDNSASNTVTISGNCIVGDFTRTDGIFGNPASPYTLTVTGDFSMSTTDAFGGANLTLNMAPTTGTKTITQNAGTVSGPFQVTTSGGATVQLATNFTTGPTCNVVDGIFDLNGNTFTCGSTFTVEDEGTLELQGSESLTMPVLNAGSTVVYTGDGDGIADSYRINDWSYKNLTVNSTDTEDIFSADNSLESGLEAYWTMDEASGSNVDDSSSNNRDATATGTTVAAGTINNARSFNGTSSDFLTVPSSLPSFSSNGFSVSIWVNPSSSASWSRFIDFGEGQSDDNILLARRSTSSDLVFEVYNGATGGFVQYTAGITNSVWQHFVATVDASGNVVIYKNGDEVQTGTTNSPQNVTRTSNFIGRSNWAADAYFAGLIDETRIYSRPLNLQEVEAIYAGTTDNSFASLTVDGNFTLIGGTFSSPGTLNISGNFAHDGGTFTHNSGTVVLDGTSQTVSGSTTFNNFTKETSSTDTLTFTAGTTQTIGGTLTLNGASSNLLSLRSSSPDTQWSINPQGTRTISYLDVEDSNNTNATFINAIGTNSTNSGGNTNWNFNTPSDPSSLGPAGFTDGSVTSETQLELTFTLSDTDSEDDVRYRIQIDDDSDFSSPTVDYTSSLGIQGSKTFTVGQAEGTGSYTEGLEGQELADSNYYWRVRTIDKYGVESSYLEANSGSVAFVIDTSAPPPSSSSSGSNSSSTPSLPQGCSSKQPTGSPELFRLDQRPTSITMFFNSANDNFDSYVIAYGLTPDANNFGANFDYSGDPGVLQYTINGLTPNTTYYFKIRASNDCAPGSWSETLSARTLGGFTSLTPTEEKKVEKTIQKRLPNATEKEQDEEKRQITEKLLEEKNEDLEDVETTNIKISTSFFTDAINAIKNFAYTVFSPVKTALENTSNKIGNNIAATIDLWFDTDPTIITNVKASDITDASMVITWETNHFATSKVNYGDSYDYGQDIQTTEKTKKHSIKITNLQPDTTYYYEVMSQGNNYVFDARHEVMTKK